MCLKMKFWIIYLLYFYIKIIFSPPPVGQASLGANNLSICQLTWAILQKERLKPFLFFIK